MNILKVRLAKFWALWTSLLVLMGAGALSGCKGRYNANLPQGPQKAEISVEKIENLSEDFIMGMDISSLLALEKSGVKYYDDKGRETDLLKILADSGINHVRVRVWNNPFDENGNGYGGGNCTVQTAAKIGKRAARYGMKLCVDFHYSDFWADPKKYYAPKAWENLSFNEKKQAFYDFTKSSLLKIISSGADVDMVQIGNEINNGLAGETNLSRRLSLIEEGTRAVREVSGKKKKDIKIVLHYTNIKNPNAIHTIANQLQKANIDYDVFGLSYYRFWDGSLDNMKNVLDFIARDFGKETCIMETSYPYTLKDGDFNTNSIVDVSSSPEYPATVQGQCKCIRDIMESASQSGALGVFYWEGAWLPVGKESFIQNSILWEKYGSGWASSYASDYDKADAALYYGGSSWDNQAFFDFNGKKLPSLDVFKYVRYGATKSNK